MRDSLCKILAATKLVATKLALIKRRKPKKETEYERARREIFSEGQLRALAANGNQMTIFQIVEQKRNHKNYDLTSDEWWKLEQEGAAALKEVQDAKKP